MAGLPKALMSQVGKGKLTLKEAWQAYKIDRAKIKGKIKTDNPKRVRRALRRVYGGGGMTKKNGRKKKKRSIRGMVDKTFKTAMVMFPELMTVVKTAQSGDWNAFPQNWIGQRTGYNTFTGQFDVNVIVTNYGLPALALGLYKLGKTMAR